MTLAVYCTYTRPIDTFLKHLSYTFLLARSLLFFPHFFILLSIQNIKATSRSYFWMTNGRGLRMTWFSFSEKDLAMYVKTSPTSFNVSTWLLYSPLQTSRSSCRFQVYASFSIYLTFFHVILLICGCVAEFSQICRFGACRGNECMTNNKRENLFLILLRRYIKGNTRGGSSCVRMRALVSGLRFNFVDLILRYQFAIFNQGDLTYHSNC